MDNERERQFKREKWYHNLMFLILFVAVVSMFVAAVFGMAFLLDWITASVSSVVAYASDWQHALTLICLGVTALALRGCWKALNGK